jgi:hypothetical protein
MFLPNWSFGVSGFEDTGIWPKTQFFCLASLRYETPEEFVIRKPVWMMLVFCLQGYKGRDAKYFHLIEMADEWDVSQLYAGVKWHLTVENFRNFG